ncbi:MAG: POTRA domain-containing protein, partial [Gammaproteobacteria bacterium]
MSAYHVDAMDAVSVRGYGHVRRRLPALVCLCCLLLAGAAAAQPVLELEISGIGGVLLDNVRAHLSLARYVRTAPGLPLPGRNGTPALPGAEEIRILHRRAPAEIREALQPYGYYEPDIKSSLEQEGERWHAHYRIVPGTPVIVASVDIGVTGAGQAEPAVIAVRDATRLRVGQRLIHPDYDATRAALLRAAQQAGYLDARYTRSELRVAPAAHRADAVLHLDTGPRYYFGAITIEQNILAPDFIERYVEVREGAPFDTAQLLDLQLALGDSGYFDQVELDVQREAAEDHHVPVIVHTVPAPHTRYTLGLGYGTDTGPRVSVGAEYLRINRRGHSINSDLRVSPVKQTAAVQYRIPIRNMISDRLVFGAELDNAEVADSGTTRGYQLSVSQNVSL